MIVSDAVSSTFMIVWNILYYKGTLIREAVNNQAEVLQVNDDEVIIKLFRFRDNRLLKISVSKDDTDKFFITYHGDNEMKVSSCVSLLDDLLQTAVKFGVDENTACLLRGVITIIRDNDCSKTSMDTLLNAATTASEDSSIELRYRIVELDGTVIIKRVEQSVLSWKHVKEWIQTNKSKIVRVILDGTLGEDCSSLFDGCYRLKEVLSTGEVSTSYVQNMERMFAGCVSLRKVNTEDWDLDAVVTTKDIFKDCDVVNNKYLHPLLKQIFIY